MSNELIKAIKEGKTAEEIESLLNDDVESVNFDVLDEGKTALMYAAEEGNTDVVKLLLDKGADINAKDEENRKTAFDYAKDNNHTEIITLLTNAKP